MKELFARIVFTSLFVICFSYSQSATPPGVINISSKDAPSIPADLKTACLIDPNSLESSTTCPVIVWNKYVYWVYSFLDNRDAMSIIAYTENGTFVKRWDFTGARYITKITVDEKTQTIALIGQVNRTITVKWNDIYLPQPPTVLRASAQFHPKILAGLKAACIQSADVVGNMDTCSILLWGPYSYWVYSYIDNRMSMNIVTYDSNGNIVLQQEIPGAQYLYNITVDIVAQTVTLWGQANRTAVVPWSKLMIQ